MVAISHCGTWPNYSWRIPVLHLRSSRLFPPMCPNLLLFARLGNTPRPMWFVRKMKACGSAKCKGMDWKLIWQQEMVIINGTCSRWECRTVSQGPSYSQTHGLAAECNISQFTDSTNWGIENCWTMQRFQGHLDKLGQGANVWLMQYNTDECVVPLWWEKHRLLKYRWTGKWLCCAGTNHWKETP